MLKWLLCFSFCVSVCFGTVEKFIEVPGGELFCRIAGEGSPLVLLHGGPGLTQDYLHQLFHQLAKTHKVIAYDQRGCGQSTTLDDYTLQTYIDDLEQIRKALKVEKISILGHSWGGFLAMEYAISHPNSIDKLILSNSMPASSEGLALFMEEWNGRMSPYLLELAEIQRSSAFLEGDSDTIERYYRLIFRTYCYSSEKADLLNLRMSSPAALNGAKVFKAIHQNIFSKEFDLFSALNRLKLPVLVIHGENDPIPAITAKKIHENIDGSKFILMDKCGHFPYVESPSSFYSYINNFLTTDI